MAATKNTKAFYNTEIPSDWKESNINEMFYFKQGVQCAVDNQFDICNEGRVRFIRIIDLTDSNEPKRYIDDPGTEHHVLPDDLFMIRYGTPGVLGYGYKGVIANNLFRIIPKTKTINQFYYYQLTFKEIQIQKLASSSTMPALNFESLSQLKLLVPPLSEQKAIAQVLSTADAAIHTTEKLIDQKELRKKWLMQQLLTGKKRLKGFGGEWKEYHLGSLGETYTGLTGKNKDDFGEGKPYIPYLNIFNNARIDVSNLDYVKITVSDIQNKVKYGDIFFTVSSETPDEVGMASVMLDEIEELYLNSFCFGFRLYDFNILVPEFSSYFLRADAFRTEIYKLSQGATRFNLSKNKLMKLNIVLPPKDEQTAIAQVLQAADKEISLLKAKAEKLREQKKGLMQQLLSGKKRIKV